MKKNLFIALLFCFIQTKAQFVTIPDTAFVNYLHSIISAAMNGNQMDTTNTAVTTLTNISAGGLTISNLTGIQYFDALIILYCDGNQLTSLPKLPSTLQYLQCSGNQLTSLPVLPNSLNGLLSNGNLLTSLPALPHTIKQMECSYNNLTGLPTLPDSLQYLNCSYNQLTSLPALPNNLHDLYCSYNQLISLPALPDSLQILKCNNNQLTNLPALPNLSLLWCNNNNISCFPPFLNSLAPQPGPCPVCPPAPLNFSNNPFNCIPNYVSVMDSVQHSYPLCSAGNSNGCAVAGINKFLENTQLKIYPNPANNKITIDATEVVEVKLFDVLGKQIVLPQPPQLHQ